LYRTSHIVRQICENFCRSVAAPEVVSKPKYSTEYPYYLERDKDDFVVARPCGGRRHKAEATNGKFGTGLVPPTGSGEMIYGNYKYASVGKEDKEGFPLVKVEFGNNKTPWSIAEAS
jgi:hypothetical protein